MTVVANGQELEVAEGTTVAGLLASLGVSAETAVVERNGAIVPRAEHAAAALAPGDRLEIVRFVGGG